MMVQPWITTFVTSVYVNSRTPILGPAWHFAFKVLLTAICFWERTQSRTEVAGGEIVIGQICGGAKRLCVWLRSMRYRAEVRSRRHRSEVRHQSRTARPPSA